MAIVRKKSKKSSLSRNKFSNKNNVSASELIKKAESLNIRTEPLDIKDLARALGIKIKSEALADDISGHLRKINNQWVITVNGLQHPRRQRFTIAHEIGHFILHSNDQNEFIDKILFRSNNWSTIELDANKFAAELLMPEDKFRNYMNHRSTAVEKLAEHFEVSSLAVRMRAKDLNIEGHGLN